MPEELKILIYAVVGGSSMVVGAVLFGSALDSKSWAITSVGLFVGGFLAVVYALTVQAQL